MIENHLGVLWKNEESYRYQRSRIKWLNGGDANTSFFHRTTIQRRLSNKVLKIKGDNDNWIEGEMSIRREFEHYFWSLFTMDGPRHMEDAVGGIHRVVTDDINLALTKPISLNEIKDAATQLGGLKAPGPDGFQGIFYHKFWQTINDVINDAALEFFQHGLLVPEMNETTIVLIPKIPVPEPVSHFRPISLCNCSYKILLKILANRIKPFLPSLISHHQGAFVPNRQIQDNILIAHETFHYLKHKKSKLDFEIGLKVNMNKAYDRVEWDFLEGVMIKMGFCNRLIFLIMSCVRTVSFSVSINGNVGDRFKPSRGIRQSDPLSPYLFLFVTESLSTSYLKHA